MAQQISQANIVVPTGPRQFVIDGLPVGSNGFEILLTRDPATMSGAGRIFTGSLQISPDNGAQWNDWHQGSPSLDAADDPRNKDGTPLTVYFWRFGWPGVYLDGKTRSQLKQTDVRLNLVVERAFASPLLIVRYW
jgi:hypothetical protein